MSLPAAFPLIARTLSAPRDRVARPAPLPDPPKPLTPASAALHLSRVPASRLTEAFAAVERAFERQGDAAAQRLRTPLAEPARDATPTKRDAQRLEKAIAPSPPPATLDLSA